MSCNIVLTNQEVLKFLYTPLTVLYTGMDSLTKKYEQDTTACADDLIAYGSVLGLTDCTGKK